MTFLGRLKMKRLVLGMVAIVAAAGIAFAAGNFPGFPIVGGATYCQGTSTGASGTPVCTVNVPAGPSIVPSSTVIPADTGLPSGAQPQTVLLGLASLNALPYAYVVPTNGTTVTVAATTGTLVLNPAGTLTTLGIALPAASTLIDGQQLAITSSQTLTAATWTAGTGNTISQTPTALTVSTTGSYGYRFLYHVLTSSSTGAPATGIWYRLQ